MHILKQNEKKKILLHNPARYLVFFITWSLKEREYVGNKNNFMSANRNLTIGSFI